jgi:hypothetical protein
MGEHGFFRHFDDLRPLSCQMPINRNRSRSRGFLQVPQKGAVGLKIGSSLRCSARVPTTPRVCVIAPRCTVLAQNREDRLSMLV